METTQAGPSTRRGNNGGDVFLSHSGKQKNFVRQLNTDLRNQGVSSFFDEDSESLPKAEEFPSIIFQRVETCKVAVLLLSKDFLETKWPMLELAAFFKAKYRSCTNPNLKILPLFFLILPGALKDINAGNEKWKQLEISSKMRDEWLEALKAIRSINGINFREGDNEVEFRQRVVKEIRRILPPSQRYHIPRMQGGERMCQHVTNCFNRVCPNEKGMRIAGLYGIAGHGKSSLGKAFCNLKLMDFEGKVCHLEFSRGGRDDSFERRKLALQYLTHCPQSYLQTLTKDQADVELHKRLKGERVLLVLDNITEECIEEVRDYIEEDLSANSYILLSARSVDFLVKHFKIDKKSCMRVPGLEEDEAIAILLERTSVEESTLGAEDRALLLKCANRCSFNSDSVRSQRTFHPLALKAFGRYLCSKYDSNLSRWVAEIDGLVDRAGYGLDGLFDVLRKAFDDIRPKYRTIFMLLTIYVLPNMPPHKVMEWLAINCNEEISFINKAVEDLCKKAFIEDFVPQIRIHDLYIEFAESTAKEMGKWLWWKGDESSSRQLISQDQVGFQLAKFEKCMRQRPPKIAPKYLGNLWLFQYIGVHNICKFDFRPMDSLRSITLQNCKDLAELEGVENLVNLAWLQIRKLNPMFKLPQLSRLEGLQHLEIDIEVTQELDQLSDLTPCSQLREINVRCPSLPEFPRLKGLLHLDKVEFSMCGEAKGPLDCTNCEMLQSIVLNQCCKMATPPVLAGCKKIYKIVLSDCDAVTACPDIDVADDEPSALQTLELSISSKAASAPRSLESCEGLENLHLWNMGELEELPSFNRLSNLTVLKIGKCGIMELPDLTCCVMLENVYFFTLKNLERFPSFSLLRELKILNLYNCRKVQDPPDISGCHELQVFHLVCNDNVKGLPKMHECTKLDEIKVSWHCEDEVTYEGIDPDSWEVDDNFQSCLKHFKDEIPVENLNDLSVPIELRDWLSVQEKSWMQGRTMLAKKYFRGVKLYCSVMAAYESYERNCYSKNYITLRLVEGKVIAFPTPGRVFKDVDWLNKVRQYFARKKDVNRESSFSDNVIISAVNGEVIASPTPGRVSKARAWLNKVQKRFDGKDCGWLNKMQGCFGGKIDIVGTSAVSECDSVEAISLPLPRYHVPPIQGEARMCQKVAEFFSIVNPNERGIRIVGLYGMPGVGKTTIARAFCNLDLDNHYDGRVFYIEFCGGNALDAQKLALQYLTHSRNSQFEWVTGEEDVRYFFCMKVEGQRVLLVLDNITEDSIDKVRDYLGAELGEGSCILLIARSVDVLLKNFNITSESCMHIPRLRAEEAIAIMLERTSAVYGGRALALKCAIRCLFKEGSGAASRFHPLALKVLGRHCFSKNCGDLSKWVDEIDSLPHRALHNFDNDGHRYFDDFGYDNHYYSDVRGMAFDGNAERADDDFDVLGMDFDDVFDVLGMAFAEMNPKARSIFMLLTLLIPPKLSSHEAIKGLAENCKEEVEDLYQKGFIEEIEPEFRIHHLMKDFAEIFERRQWQDNQSPLLQPRYLVPAMQGEARMCQKLADFLSTIRPNERGIIIAGLYGVRGQGKTTLSKAFCNLNMGNYGFRVCHLEFCGGNTLQRQKHALQNLTHCPQSQLRLLRSEVEAKVELYRRVKGERVLLILDHIKSDLIIREVRDYLRAELGEGSCILIIARSADFLVKHFGIHSQSCMGVPRLTEEEATTIFLEKALEKPALSLFCKYAFGIATIPSNPQNDIELVHAECRGLPEEVQEIVFFNSFLNRLKRSIDALDDDEKQCFLDLAAFPQRESIPANALLDIWVYVRGMTQDKAVLLLLKLAARHLLHLRRDTRLKSIRDDCMNSYNFSQDDAVRYLALFLAECDNRFHFRKMYVSQKLFQFYEKWQTDMNQPSEAQIVSIRTVAMTETQWPQIDFPEAEALILYFTASEYCIPPFLFKMEKLKVLIIHDIGLAGKLTGLDNFQALSHLKTLHLEMLIVPSVLEHCTVFSKSLEKIRLSRCKDLGRDTMFDFSGLLECYVDSCTDLKELPARICSSTSLKVLSITCCGSLKKLPNELDRLGSLKEITLCGCSCLKALPPSICQLTNLEILDISHCTGLYVNGDGHFVLTETLQKLAKLPSLKCVICDKHIKEIVESSFRPGLLKVGVE